MSGVNLGGKRSPNAARVIDASGLGRSLGRTAFAAVRDDNATMMPEVLSLNTAQGLAH
jgi:hypothetical protein